MNLQYDVLQLRNEYKVFETFELYSYELLNVFIIRLFKVVSGFRIKNIHPYY